MKPDRAEAAADPEVVVYLAARNQRVSRRRLAFTLGWTPEQLDNVRRRAERYIASAPLQRERSVAGTRLGELYSLWFPPLPSSSIDRGNNADFQTYARNVNTELLNSLQEARLKLDRLQVESQAALSRAAEAEIRLAQLHAEEETDGAQAVLESRPVDGKFAKAISGAEADLKTAKKVSAAHARALSQHRASIDKIEEELSTRRREAFEAAFAEPQRRLVAALDEFTAAALHARHAADLHGYQLTDQLFTNTRADVRARQLQTVWAAIAMYAYWSEKYVDAPGYEEPEVSPRPFVVTSPALKRDPLQLAIDDERVRLSILNEQYSSLYSEQLKAENEANALRYKRRSVEGGWIPLAPGDKPEYDRLTSIVEDKERDLKLNQADRQKCIEEITKLEKELQAKRTAVAA